MSIFDAFTNWITETKEKIINWAYLKGIGKIPTDSLSNYYFDEINQVWKIKELIPYQEPEYDINRRLQVETPNFKEFTGQAIDEITPPHELLIELDFTADSVSIVMYDIKPGDNDFWVYYAIDGIKINNIYTSEIIHANSENAEDEVFQADCKPSREFMIKPSALSNGDFKWKITFSKQKKTKISDIAYVESEFDGIIDIGLSKNVFRDVIETLSLISHNHNLADLAEKLHASLTSIGTSDHHVRYTDAEVSALIAIHTALVNPHQTKLDDILNPSGDTHFQFANKHLHFDWTVPDAGADQGAFEIEAKGAFSGDLLHIHQHTGNPGITNLIHVEAEDDDCKNLHMIHGSNIFGFGKDGLELDANLTLASTRIIDSADEDLDFTFGRNEIGSLFADTANWAHRDLFNVTDYAFRHTASGNLHINTKTGGTIFFKINNTELARLTASALTMSIPLDMRTNLLTVGDSADIADPIELLKFNTERSWSFRKRNTGASTRLSLESASNAKQFWITYSDGTTWAAKFFIANIQADNYAFLYRAKIGDGADHLEVYSSGGIPRIKIIGGENLFFESDGSDTELWIVNTNDDIILHLDSNDDVFIYLKNLGVIKGDITWNKGQSSLNISCIGEIKIRPSGDNANYVSFSTSAGVPLMSFIGGNGLITNVADPTNAQDVATKAYADSVATVHDHDGHTLQLDGINSDGGAFDFVSSLELNFKIYNDNNDYLFLWTNSGVPRIAIAGGNDVYLHNGVVWQIFHADAFTEHSAPLPIGTKESLEALLLIKNTIDDLGLDYSTIPLDAYYADKEGKNEGVYINRIIWHLVNAIQELDKNIKLLN